VSTSAIHRTKKDLYDDPALDVQAWKEKGRYIVLTNVPVWINFPHVIPLVLSSKADID